MSNIINPLYSRPKGDGKPIKNVSIARIENAVAGVCPKCQQPMGKANLGQCMANQSVYFCQTCRVAEPIEI